MHVYQQPGKSDKHNCQPGRLTNTVVRVAGKCSQPMKLQQHFEPTSLIFMISTQYGQKNDRRISDEENINMNFFNIKAIVYCNIGL